MPDILTFERVSAGYGPTVILDDISLSVAEGELVAVLGRNGVGKTTLLATAMGHTGMHAGEIRLSGETITRWPIWRRARRGIGFVPQEREIFPSLSVEENLTVAKNGMQWSVERIFDLFPRLAERRNNRGNQLSGGEQQMLAVGRALMGSPSLLLLDEPLEGLAPVIVDALMAAFRRLRQEEGLTMVLVEQHAKLALELAPRAIILDRGRVAFDGLSRDLSDRPETLASLLAVG